MEIEFKAHSLFTARVILGIIFIAASIGKINNPGAFAEIIRNYQILPEYLINDFAVFLPYIELFTAVMLIAGIFMKGASILSLLMLSGFAGALVFNMTRGLNISCGCFTSVSEEVTNFHYIYYITRDIIFLTIAGYITKNIFSEN